MATTTARPASDKQTNLIGSLVVERATEDISGPDGDALSAFLNGDGLSSREASSLISALFDAPRVPRARVSDTAPVGDVPAGRYALDVDGFGNLDFVQVDRPEKGKWAGYTFVKRLLGAPGDFREVRVPREVSSRMLTAIAADAFHDDYTDPDTGVHTEQRLTGPRAGAVRFSRRFKVCSACMSPLTDPESRARGLGPICAKRH